MRRWLVGTLLWIPVALHAQVSPYPPSGLAPSYGPGETGGTSPVPVNPLLAAAGADPAAAAEAYARGRPGMAGAYVPGARTPVEAEPGLGFKPAEGVPNAAAQGFGARDLAQEAQEWADEVARSTPRQRGEVIPQPAPLPGVSSDPALGPWLHAWTGLLLNSGVGAEKIAFEAHRLDEESFARWASRQVWSADKTIYVVPVSCGTPRREACF